jgi:chromosome segregation ATPase
VARQQSRLAAGLVPAGAGTAGKAEQGGARMTELTKELEAAREQLRTETARIQADLDRANEKATQFDQARAQLQAQIDSAAQGAPKEDARKAIDDARALNNELTIQLMENEATRETLATELEAAKAAAADAAAVRAELSKIRQELETTRTNDMQAVTALRSKVNDLEARVGVLTGPVEIAVRSIVAMGSRVSGVQGNSAGEVKLVRMEAERALREVGAPGIEALIAALTDENALIRDFAADQLGRLGKSAQAALPELNRMAAQDSEPEVRNTAQRAISRIVGN